MSKDHRSIGELAYQLWQARGCPPGSAEQDWLEAERQLRAAPPKTPALTAKVDDSLKASFPASDPPASQLIDKPPVNAEAKWRAAGVARKTSPRRSPPAQTK